MTPSHLGGGGGCEALRPGPARTSGGWHLTQRDGKCVEGYIRAISAWSYLRSRLLLQRLDVLVGPQLKLEAKLESNVGARASAAPVYSEP